MSDPIRDALAAHDDIRARYTERLLGKPADVADAADPLTAAVHANEHVEASVPLSTRPVESMPTKETGTSVVGLSAGAMPASGWSDPDDQGDFIRNIVAAERGY